MRIPGTMITLPAEVIPARETSDERAWAGERFTVLLTSDYVHALRVAMSGEGLGGRWFAIGDFFLARTEYARRHALPPRRSGPLRGRRAFLLQAAATLHAGSVLNVGRCSARFEAETGGGYQAEYIEGPREPSMRPIDGWWMDRVGHA